MRTPPHTVPNRNILDARGAAVLAIAASWLAACGGSEEPTSLAEAGDGSANGAVNGAGPALAEPARDEGFIEGEVEVGGACASEVASDTFASAVCSCEDVNVAGYLRTTSFRSRPAPTAAGEELGGGSVGVNRDYFTAGYADVAGNFTVAGDRNVAFGGYLKAGADIRANPELDVAGLVRVGRDAFLKSDARVIGRVEIGRDLYMDAGAAFNGIALLDVGGERRTEAIEIEAPCPCAAGEIIDVAALVDQAETDNDNARVGLAPDELGLVVGLGAETTLPTGRYFVQQLGGVGSFTLHVEGKVALFVADDWIATGLFRVELAPEAELDVFVRDNLVVTGAALFGDPERPSATRIYVGGTGDVAIAGASAFVGNLYAPAANVLVGGAGKVYGSLFGKNIVAAGFLDLGYDLSVQDGGRDCPPVDSGDIPRIQ
jgi:hypothetical protein